MAIPIRTLEKETPVVVTDDGAILHTMGGTGMLPLPQEFDAGIKAKVKDSYTDDTGTYYLLKSTESVPRVGWVSAEDIMEAVTASS